MNHIDLKNLNVVELSTQEKQNVNGGKDGDFARAIGWFIGAAFRGIVEGNKNNPYTDK